MDTKPIQELKLPSTAEAESVRAYLLAQAGRDFSKGIEFFTDDIAFNDVLYPVCGRDEVITSLSEYVEKYLTKFRVEAVCEAGASNKYLVMCFIGLRGKELEIPTCDLINLRGGKICRVDICYNKEKLNSIFHS